MGGSCSYCEYGFNFDANRACVLQDGFTLVSLFNSTVSCPNLCKRCTYQANPYSLQCTECYSTLVLNATTYACECPLATYFESALKQCVSCADSKCVQCASSSSCQLCESPFLAQNNTYLCGCALGGFRSGTICEPCHAHCRTCRGPTSGDCLSCYENADLSGDIAGTCLCRSGSAQTLCDPLVCDTTCLTCSGSDYNDCLSCHASGQLDSTTCPCYPSVTVGSNCRRCPASCQQCNNSGGCSSCSHPLAYIPSTRPGECVCRGYPNPTSANCSLCHYTCKECSGPAANQCTVCGLLAVLKSTNVCECEGLREIASSGDCYPANFFCEDAFCSTCKNNAVKNGITVLNNGGRYETCSCPSYVKSSALTPVRYITNYYSGMCVACGLLCQDCSLETNLCLSCTAHASLVLVAPALRTGYCTCQSGYYENSGECWKCSEGCLVCSSLLACTSCTVGYELKVSGLQSSCSAFRPTTGCAQGSFLLRQTGKCETTCPSGFLPMYGECQESGQTKFTWRFDQFSAPYYDSSGNFTLSSSSQDIYPVYKRGLRILSNYTSISLYNSRLILAPTFYIEAWFRGSYISFSRSSSISYVSFNVQSADNWWTSIQLHDTSGNLYYAYPDNNPTYSSNPPTGQWQRVRLELVSTVEGRNILTKYRLTLNERILGESSIRNFYYRDGSMDAASTSLYISFSQVGPETYIAEFTVANRVWRAETTSCGCPLCTSGGFCLSNCALNQYQREDACLACPPTCTQGCIRGSDCGLNLDPLCTKFANFTSCQTCHSMAVRKDGACACQAHAKFLASNSTCVCDEQAKLNSAGFCAKCLNYLRAEEISAEIDESFMSLILTFKKPMAVASRKCADLFSSKTIEKFGEEATCSWSPNRKQLTVQFGGESTLMVEEVELNYESFLSSEGPCSFEAVKLRPTAAYKGMMPAPVPVLSAPTMVALGCGVSQRPPVVSAQGTKGGKGRKLQYKWTFQHSTMGVVLTTFESYSDVSSFTPAFAALAAGNLTVTVTVRNAFLKEASASSTIQLTDTRALSVQFETGPQLSLTSQDQGQVRTLATASCGVSSDVKSFQWNFLSVSPALAASEPDPKAVLQASNSPATLFIRKNALAAGHSYIFQAVVTQGAVQGSANLNVTVVPSNLVVRFNRISGSNPSDMTLRLDGSLSYDPDNSPGQMSYLWTCSEGTEGCKDSAGAGLLRNASAETQLLQANSLRSGAVYNLSLTITKDSRKASSFVVMTIVQPTGCSIVLKPFQGVINSGLPLSIVAAISADLEVDFLWRQVAGPVASPTGPLTFAYISFGAGSLQGGQTYGFELTAKTTKGNLIAAFQLYLNRGPVGGKTAATPSSGRALLDQFMLATEGWEDPESDYPLYYQFCLSKGSSSPICVGALSLKLWTYMKLYPGDITVTARVFDYYGAQAQSTAVVTVSPAARRLLQSLTTTFQEDVQDPENTCGVIVVYCQSTQATESLYSAMLSALRAYVQALNQVDLKSVESVLGAVEALAGEPPAKTPSQASSLLSILKSVVSSCVDSLTLASIQRVLSIITQVANSTEDSIRLESADTASAVMALFNGQRLPNEAAASYSSELMGSYAARATGGLLGSLAMALGNNATVVAPAGWLNGTNIASTDIIDIYARTYVLNSSFAWVVDVALQRAGSYANYNLALASPTSLTLPQLAVPVNVTIPFSHLPANATLECIVLMQGSWTQACQVLEIRNHSAVVSSSYLLPLSLRGFVPVETPSIPSPSNPSDSDSDCILNPAPLSIACAAFLLALAALGLLFLGSPQTPKEPRAVEESVNMTAHPIIVTTNFEQPKQEIASSCEIRNPELPVDKSSSRLLEFHLLFSSMFLPKLRIRKVWTLVSTLEVEALVLGICYAFWDDRAIPSTSANDVFSDYSEQDLVYVAISVSIGAAFCVSLQLFRLHPVPSGVSAVLALGAVLYLNVERCCYSAAGRWGEGLMWTVLLQLLVVETAKAAVMLLWSKRRIAGK